MKDYISRADAIEAVMAEGRKVYASEYANAERIIYEADAVEALSMLPSADAEQGVGRYENAMQKLREMPSYLNGVKEKQITKISADAVQGEWVDWLGNGNEWECSICKCSVESHGSIAYKYCPMCGARMENTK